MKRIFFIIATTVMASTAWAQSQQLQTIKGKTKDGKSINVQYYKGTAQDYIESVKYQLVDELKADNTSKQNSINDLQYQLNKANKRIDNLNDQLKNCGDPGQVTTLKNQLKEKEGEIDQLNEQVDNLGAQLKEMQAENERLRAQLDSIKAVNQQLSQKKNRPVRNPYVGVEASMGSVFLSNSGLNNPWAKSISWNKQVEVYFGSDRLSEGFPVSLEAGVGFRSLPMSAVIEHHEIKDIYQPDIDGQYYQPEYVFDNYTEKLTMNCLEVPVRLCIGQPEKDKISVYAKLGLAPSFILSSKLVNGPYSKKGYYSNWNVTFEDINELGFFNAGGNGEKALTTDKRFNLWGNAAFGAYVPLGSSLLFNVGAKLDYPILKTGSFESLDVSTDKDKLPIPDGLTKYYGRMLIPNLQAGLVYTLK